MKIAQKASQKGLTLIELMISMSLGLVVSIAAVQLFITAFSSFNLQRGLGDVSENGRFGLDFVAKNISTAQYATGKVGKVVSAMQKSINQTSPEGSAIVTEVSELPGSPAGLASANNSINLGIGSSDQLVTRTWIPSVGPAQRDCEGNVILIPANADGIYSVARYFLRADTTTASTSALACDAGRYSVGDAAVTDFGDAGIVLLNAVDSFQILYGISADATTTPPVVVRYVTSAQYAAFAVPRPRVAAIRLGALVRSSDSVGNLVGGSPTVNVLDAVITGASQDAAGSKILRRVFVSTVALRNAL